MANTEQLSQLRKGSSNWSKWKKKHPDSVIDLAGANLRGADLFNYDLRKADLSRADLSGADLSCANLTAGTLLGANLTEADLGGARLAGADLREARLARADLSKADLAGANFTQASLAGANLDQADLSRANLSEADLGGAALSEARLYRTLFVLTSLRAALGLESCLHVGPSSLDWETLIQSGPLPEVFLRGCGLADEHIRFLPELWQWRPRYASCLISYSRSDQPFARRLHEALQNRGLRCWLDEHPVLPGEAAARPINDRVGAGDIVLLCCSTDSLKRLVGEQAGRNRPSERTAARSEPGPVRAGPDSSPTGRRPVALGLARMDSGSPG